jgi:hypothetical protein
VHSLAWRRGQPTEATLTPLGSQIAPGSGMGQSLTGTLGPFCRLQSTSQFHPVWFRPSSSLTVSWTTFLLWGCRFCFDFPIGTSQLSSVETVEGDETAQTPSLRSPSHLHRLTGSLNPSCFCRGPKLHFTYLVAACAILSCCLHLTPSRVATSTST